MLAKVCLTSLQIAAEAGRYFLEGASHGIASTDCFELFGFPEDAPNLRDNDFSADASGARGVCQPASPHVSTQRASVLRASGSVYNSSAFVQTSPRPPF